jgi:hypothetical protein
VRTMDGMADLSLSTMTAAPVRVMKLKYRDCP